MQYNTFITIFVYFAWSVALIWAIRSERRDLYCSTPACDICYKGNGAVYAQGIPNDDDTKYDLLDKLQVSCRYDVNSVTWRRCLIFSSIAGFMVSLFLKGPPSGVQLATAFFTIYFMCYLMYEFYAYELAKPALRHIDETIDRLRNGQDGPGAEQSEESSESEEQEEIPDIEGMLEMLNSMPVSETELFYKEENHDLQSYSSDDE